MMTSARHRGRLGLVALFVVVWSLLGVAVPLFHAFDSSPSSGVYAAPKDVFTVGEPISLGYGLSLARATMTLSDRVQEGTSVERILASGKANLVVEGGILRFDPRGAPGPSEEYLAPMIAAVAGGQFETIKLRGTQLVLVIGDERTETLSNLSVDITNRRRSGIAMQGTAALRSLPHAIDLQIATPSDRRAPMRLPLRASIRGPLLSGTLDGRLAVGEPLNLQGMADLSLGELRETARAFGLDVGPGDGLGPMKARGRLDWNRTMITLDRAIFLHDAGEASGTLALDLEQTRPSLSGTLALKSLDVTRLAAALQRSSDGRSWADFGRARPFLPLAQDLDVDIRVSSGSVKLGALELGATAATINLKRSKLNAELAEVEFAGGKGAAQATADLSLAAPKLAWRAKITGLDAAKATSFLWGSPVLSGPATVQADISTEGADGAVLASSARGTVILRMQEGGRVGVDLKSMFAASAGAVTTGWDAWTRTTTAVDALEAQLSLRNGVVSTDAATAQIGDIRYEVSGRLDRSAMRLDARIRHVRDGKNEDVKLDGDAASPKVVRETSQGRAAAPNGPGRPPG